MSICKELIEMMGGKIEVASSKGKGTAVLFTIEFEKGSTSDIPLNHAGNITAGFLKGKTILVADDNDMNRLVASTILENYGASVVEAANGEDVITVLNKNKTDLVLMDIQMPVLNGYESTRIIRSQGNKVPIIALTANAIKGENEKCIEAGMNDYIAKPFKEEAFWEKIAYWLNAEMKKTTAKPVTEFINKAPLYDLFGLQEISRSNPAFVQKMVALFCEQSPVMILQIKEALENDKLETMAAIAHKLKPSIDNPKINSLKQVIRNIKTAGKENNKTAELMRQVQLADEIINIIIQQFKQEFHA